MRHLTQRIENLSPAKRALLEAKLRAQSHEAKDVPSGLPAVLARIPLRADRDRAPLTYAQESLWFLEQLNPQMSLYNLSDAQRLQGALDVTAVQQALEQIVARHDALRTSFSAADGTPYQIVAPTVALPFVFADASAQPDSAEAMLAAMAEEPFDLSVAPLVRFMLVRLRAEEHILLVVMHHIISDGWSVGVFWKEFAAQYESCLRAVPAAVPNLSVQFGDYAAWQRDHLRGRNLDLQLAYWQKQLAGAPALLELPTDRARPVVQSFHGAQYSVVFPKALHAGLQSLSQREGVTLFMTTLAVFYAWLARLTGQTDLLVGSPLAGRSQTETEDLIGFFVNMLALRTEVEGDPTFRDLLKQVRETALGAYSHQDTPFETLVAELRPERSLSYNPIFQTAFALQPQAPTALRCDRLQLSPVKLNGVTAKFDFFLSLWEEPDGLRATVEYSTDLFDATTIARWLQHYQNLLEGIVADPALRISELPLLSAAERHQLLWEWNGTATAYPHDASIHQLFEAQTARTPDAVAVVCGEIHLTYRELNRRANQVAHYLRAQGVGTDTLVGLFTERSLLMVIGVLGILKAGGAYLPLDTSYPAARLQFMLEDAQTPVLLTQQKLLARVPQTTAQVICLDTDGDLLARQPEGNPVNQTQPDHLAYVIYTSGSTGQPKGTAIEHRAVNRLVCDTNYVQLSAQDCLAQISNVSFDAATFELWGALLHGARLVILPKDIALSPQEFVAHLRQHKVTTMFVTTALFNLLSREVPDAFRTLKTVLFGGEACDPNCVRDVLRHGAPERLLHVYGPTESTTFASWHLVEQVPANATTIPIGRPIANTTLYVLDRDLNPVPVGIPGELYVGGDGLAREYWRRPGLTAEKFISIADCRLWNADSANPKSAIQNPKLYRTGDLVRLLPDGNIEFIGRKDRQVKLRGFRIELDEIEAALLQHSAVQDCVVVVAEDKLRGKRLLAYYVATEPLTTDDLRAFLQRRLPEFMLPAVFCYLDELPLTPNGKVDRRRLPTPDETPMADAVSRPTDELELRLTWIWEEVLGLSAIGTQDNFFALGGHSLLAVRLFSAIEKLTGQRLPLATLFQAPTITALANVLRQRGWQPSWRSLVALRSTGTKPPFFCVHAVGGNVLEYNALAQEILERVAA